MTSAPILVIQATQHLMQVPQCTGMLHVVSNTVNEAPHQIEMTESISDLAQEENGASSCHAP